MEKNLSEAIKYYELGCDYGVDEFDADKCRAVAMIYEEGEMTKANPKKAKEALKKACKLNPVYCEN